MLFGQLVGTATRVQCANVRYTATGQTSSGVGGKCVCGGGGGGANRSKMYRLVWREHYLLSRHTLSAVSGLQSIH